MTYEKNIAQGLLSFAITLSNKNQPARKIKQVKTARLLKLGKYVSMSKGKYIRVYNAKNS